MKTCPICLRDETIYTPLYIQGCDCQSRISKGLPVQRFTGEYEECDGGFLLKLRQPFSIGDSFGDMLSLDVETQSLFIANHFNLEDLDIGYNYGSDESKYDDEELETREEMDEFFTSNFRSRDYARGFIRRMLINRTRD